MTVVADGVPMTTGEPVPPVDVLLMVDAFVPDPLGVTTRIS